MSPTPDIAVCPDPAFEIDDVNMKTADVDVNTELAIVSRGGLNHINECSDSITSRYGAHNATDALIPSHNYHTLIPVTHSEAIVPARSDDQAERAPKRYRIDYEHVKMRR